MKEVNEIDTELDRRINEILESGFNTPSIFKKILGKETAFAKDEKILGFVNVEKEYVNQVEKKEVYSNSKLVVATNFGIIIVEEGIDNDNLDFGGYRIRYIMYSKINCLEIDTSLLLGIFKIAFGSCKEDDIIIEFDKTRDFKNFEMLNDILRNKIIECECLLLKNR